MTGLLIVVGFIFIVVLVREFRHLLYVREVRQMHTISELEARENAAPLSSAIIHRLPGDR
jgi:hypothetical protein